MFGKENTCLFQTVGLVLNLVALVLRVFRLEILNSWVGFAGCFLISDALLLDIGILLTLLYISRLCVGVDYVLVTDGAMFEPKYLGYGSWVMDWAMDIFKFARLGLVLTPPILNVDKNEF